MGVVSITAEKIAKLGGESRLLKNESSLRTNFSVMQAVRTFCRARDLSPLSEIRAAVKARASDRMIQYWLENKYSISANDLADLLRSNAGFSVLENLMGQSRPVWWRSFKRGVKRSELRRQQALLAKAIEDNEQGELEL